MRVRLGRGFGWLWSAYAVSTYGTWIAFGAFPLTAVRVLHSPAFAVSLLEAAGLAVAAVVAITMSGVLLVATPLLLPKRIHLTEAFHHATRVTTR